MIALLSTVGNILVLGLLFFFVLGVLTYGNKRFGNED
jgi:hypothetical protein